MTLAQGSQADGAAIPLLTIEALAEALGRGDQPTTGLQALGGALQQRIGFRLFTMLVLDWKNDCVRRYYSNRPDEYPAGGTKPLRRDSEFFETVVVRGVARICHDRADCIKAFPDHELIFSLGCESAVNVPVKWNGRVIASLNLLDRAGAYTESMLPELACLAAFAVPVAQEILSSA
jgi:hypothetical protein